VSRPHVVDIHPASKVILHTADGDGACCCSVLHGMVMRLTLLFDGDAVRGAGAAADLSIAAAAAAAVVRHQVKSGVASLLVEPLCECCAWPCSAR
jgi:hypothetical protein